MPISYISLWYSLCLAVFLVYSYSVFPASLAIYRCILTSSLDFFIYPNFSSFLMSSADICQLWVAAPSAPVTRAQDGILVRFNELLVVYKLFILVVYHFISRAIAMLQVWCFTTARISFVSSVTYSLSPKSGAGLPKSAMTRHELCETPFLHELSHRQETFRPKLARLYRF